MISTSCMFATTRRAGTLHIDVAELQSARKKAVSTADITKSSELFGGIITEILTKKISDLGSDNNSAAGKVGQIFRKLYPLMKLALGLVQGASEVPPLC